MLQTILILVIAAMFFDPLRWIVAFVIVALVRNLDPASKMSFFKLVCTAVVVTIVLEINLWMTPEARDFNVYASLFSVVVSLLIVWLINLVITLWWSRNTFFK